MEPTLYEESPYSANMNHLKKKLTLEGLDADNKNSKRQKLQNSVLTSPDLHMLKLASPELERIILAQHGLVTTTPTPSQYIFPKNVTEEQEMYARGFVDALKEIRENHQEVPGAAASYTSLEPVTTAVQPTTTYVPPVHVKEESSYSPPYSPINMEDQETAKLERKRYRNRVAASKCRQRKLERIVQLENKVKVLRDDNAELAAVVNRLKDQVCNLKSQVMDHVNSGCQIMLPQKF